MFSKSPLFFLYYTNFSSCCAAARQPSPLSLDGTRTSGFLIALLYPCTLGHLSDCWWGTFPSPLISSYLLGPCRSLTGSVITVLKRLKTALTVMPIRRNGRRRSQAIGYKMSARWARGQQKINKISQSIISLRQRHIHTSYRLHNRIVVLIYILKRNLDFLQRCLKQPI